jgi:hypothetical protein
VYATYSKQQQHTRKEKGFGKLSIGGHGEGLTAICNDFKPLF